MYQDQNDDRWIDHDDRYQPSDAEVLDYALQDIDEDFEKCWCGHVRGEHDLITTHSALSTTFYYGCGQCRCTDYGTPERYPYGAGPLASWIATGIIIITGLVGLAIIGTALKWW